MPLVVPNTEATLLCCSTQNLCEGKNLHCRSLKMVWYWRPKFPVGTTKKWSGGGGGGGGGGANIFRTKITGTKIPVTVSYNNLLCAEHI